MAKKARADPSEECRKWRAAQPPEVARVTAAFDYDLFAAMGRATQIELRGFLSCFQNGFPVLGEFSAPGVFPVSDFEAPASRSTTTFFRP